MIFINMHTTGRMQVTPIFSVYFLKTPLFIFNLIVCTFYHEFIILVLTFLYIEDKTILQYIFTQ